MPLNLPSVRSILFHRPRFGFNLRSYQFRIYLEDHNGCNSYGTTPLHVLSVTNYDTEVSEELIKSRAQVNAENHFGYTPLHFAVIHGNEWMIDILIEHGADVNIQDKNGNTALHFAVRNSRTLRYVRKYSQIVRKLIKNGAGIDTINNNYETPLMYAIMEDNLYIVKELLAFGTNVNIRNTGLETCLHVAARNVNPNSDILMELVKHGACINCLDEDGKTVLDVLLHSRNPAHGFKCAKALIKVATLVNFEHEVDLRVAKEFRILDEFIRKCYEEVLKMKSIDYTKNFSLCHFALNGECNANLPKESIFDKVLETLSNYTFPIYDDFIMVNFKRSYLCEKLPNLDIYAKKEGSNESIHLNPDIISEILLFLSDGDLLNLIRAYTKSFVPLSDVEENLPIL